MAERGLGERRREVEGILGSDTTEVGSVWRWLGEGLDGEQMRARLRCTPGHINNLTMQIEVLRDGYIPDAPSRALKGAQKVRGWLRSPTLSSHLRRLLTEQERELMAVVNGTATALAAARQGLITVPEVTFEWPTIEWVKDPVVVETGLPNGQPILMRHFTDCTHWFRGPAGQWIGDPPRLASDDQMRKLPACKDCIHQATKFNNPARGPRSIMVAKEDPVLASEADPALLSDAMAFARRRVEQGVLRKSLLAGRDVAPCALCGRQLPATLLIAAHIVPRHRLTEAERFDFVTAAMLACSLGCDALFEAGYLVVDESRRVAVCRPTTNDALRAVIRSVVGQRVTGVDDKTAENFERHRRLHS